LKRELEFAVAFFEKSSKESEFSPAKFCHPFYRSYLAITFQEAKDDEVQRYLAEAKDAVGGSESKDELLKAVENLANALQESQRLKSRSVEDVSSELDTYRWYCDKAASHMEAAKDKAPGAVELMKKCNPLLEAKIQTTILEIQKKAKQICQITQGSGTTFESHGMEINIAARALSFDDISKTQRGISRITSQLKNFCRLLPEGERELVCSAVKEIELVPDFPDKLDKIELAIAYVGSAMKTALLSENDKKRKESKHMDYHDLSIRVQKNGDVLAISDQGGDSHGKLNLDRNAIDLALQLIEEDKTNEDLLKRVGSTLYNALFDINLSKQFSATFTAADQSGCGVRLRLIFEDPKTAAIPWEFLYDDSTNTFLANNPQTALSRYIDLPLKKQDIRPASLPLRMLLVISGPTDLATLDSAGEEKRIRQALDDHIKQGQIEIDVLTKATIVEIDQKLSEKPYNVFHFIGHGIFKDNKGQIALINEEGRAQLVDDQVFANQFLGKRGLGLAILNSCEGSAKSSNQVFAGMAPRLVQRGIPAVIAMQYSIRDDTAKLFADKFYRSLALGKPADEAVQSTRNLISMQSGLDKRDFATPVLYMRAKDGVILDLARPNPKETHTGTDTGNKSGSDVRITIASGGSISIGGNATGNVFGSKN
jgi:hypothetical protein